MVTGTVKWFDEGKGFGYIAPDDGSNEVYVHLLPLYSAGFRALKKGQKVSFYVTQDSNGMQASNLKIA